MPRHLLGVLEPSVVLQVNSDASCPPGVTSDAVGWKTPWALFKKEEALCLDRMQWPPRPNHETTANA
jgi:hypothetical protein